MHLVAPLALILYYFGFAFYLQLGQRFRLVIKNRPGLSPTPNKNGRSNNPPFHNSLFANTYAFGFSSGLSLRIPSTIAERALMMPLASYGINTLLAVPCANFGSISRYFRVINSLFGLP
jgi:hypothetical protein